jgi:hypothetical protein
MTNRLFARRQREADPISIPKELVEDSEGSGPATRTSGTVADAIATAGLLDELLQNPNPPPPPPQDPEAGVPEDMRTTRIFESAPPPAPDMATTTEMPIQASPAAPSIAPPPPPVDSPRRLTPPAPPSVPRPSPRPQAPHHDGAGQAAALDPTVPGTLSATTKSDPDITATSAGTPPLGLPAAVAPTAASVPPPGTARLGTPAEVSPPPLSLRSLASVPPPASSDRRSVAPPPDAPPFSPKSFSNDEQLFGFFLRNDFTEARLARCVAGIYEVPTGSLIRFLEAEVSYRNGKRVIGVDQRTRFPIVHDMVVRELCARTTRDDRCEERFKKLFSTEDLEMLQDYVVEDPFGPLFGTPERVAAWKFWKDRARLLLAARAPEEYDDDPLFVLPPPPIPGGALAPPDAAAAAEPVLPPAPGDGWKRLAAFKTLVTHRWRLLLLGLMLVAAVFTGMMLLAKRVTAPSAGTAPPAATVAAEPITPANAEFRKCGYKKNLDCHSVDPKRDYEPDTGRMMCEVRKVNNDGTLDMCDCTCASK